MNSVLPQSCPASAPPKRKKANLKSLRRLNKNAFFFNRNILLIYHRYPLTLQTALSQVNKAGDAKTSPLRERPIGVSGARYYDPVIGRFISADTIVQAPGDPQTLNRYAYVRNNPIIYTDPNGHWFGLDDLIASVVGAIFGAAEAAISGDDIAKGALKGAARAWIMYNTGMELKEAGIIQVTQAGAQTVTNLPAAIGAHFVAGAASGAFDTAVDGGNLGQNMLTSAISAGVAKGAGSFIPDNITGNAYADFGIGLAGHAGIGGVTGGTFAEIYGGDFGEGFRAGARDGAYGYTFNRMGGRVLSIAFRTLRTSLNITALSYLLGDLGGALMNEGSESMFLNKMLSNSSRFVLYSDNTYFDKITGGYIQIQHDNTVLIKSSFGSGGAQRVDANYYINELFGR